MPRQSLASPLTFPLKCSGNSLPSGTKARIQRPPSSAPGDNPGYYLTLHSDLTCVLVSNPQGADWR